jgi:hypothetical protein
VANTLADGLGLPIVGTAGDDWQKQGIAKLQKGDNQQIVLPEYGAPPHITQQKR